MKRIFRLNALLLLLITGFACQKAQDTSTQNQSSSQASTNIAPAAEPVNARINLVKFSDYQCPACKVFAPFVHQLKEDFGDEISVTYKHFPLSIHPYAHLAARSAEAARVQGKYQEMHDMIFEGQEQWSRGNAETIFIGYARALGLDVEKFRQDMNSADMNRIVMADRRDGRDLGVNSTPTFYVNGKKLENNPGSYPAFKALVEQYAE